MSDPEFHLHAAPSMQHAGRWEVGAATVGGAADAPVNVEVTPAFNRTLLNQLRAAAGYPNPDFIRQAGSAVWASLLPPPLDAAFRRAREWAAGQGASLRIRLTATGHGLEGQGDTVQPTELPLEVLFDSVLSYLAHNPRLLLSRRTGSDPDVPPLRTALPLRMLVVTAAPNDLPDPGIEAERAALEKVLSPATAQGALVLDFCRNAKPSDLRAMLEDRNYHMLHFIGHGGFAPAGLGGEPMGYICLESPGDGSSFTLDAETLYGMLLVSKIRLVVLSACSTAATGHAMPMSPYPPAAFGGMAQRLVSGDSTVAAVVAMQFDFESQAAPLFSGAFYKALALKNVPVDEAVCSGRLAIYAEMTAGHRAWITPALFARCEGARVFDVPPLVAALGPEAAKELASLDTLSRTYQTALDRIARSAEATRADPQIDSLRQGIEASWKDAEERRAELLGDTLRLLGNRGSRGSELACVLVLRLRTAARIGLLAVSFECAQADFRLVSVTPDPAVPGAAVDGVQTPDRIELSCADLTRGNVLSPGEYPLAGVVLQATGTAPIGLTALKSAAGATVIRDGGQSMLQVLAAALVVEAN